MEFKFWRKKGNMGEPKGKPRKPTGKLRARKHYKEEETEKLREMLQEDKSPEEISIELKRTRGAIYKKINKLRLETGLKGEIAELLKTKGELEGQLEILKGEISRLIETKGELEEKITLLKGKYEKLVKDYEETEKFQAWGPAIMALIERRKLRKLASPDLDVFQ